MLTPFAIDTDSLYVPFDTYTSFTGFEPLAAEMPAWIVFFGDAIVPAFESLPRTPSTKIAFALFPTIPSQLPSTFASVGLSTKSVTWHSQPFDMPIA